MSGRIGFFFLLILWGLTALVCAQSFDGRVVDVFEKNVTVRMDLLGPLNAGDRVDLSYVAETMEFLIGQYQIVQVKENVFIAGKISSSMPPSKEMKVRVTKAAQIIYEPKAAAGDPNEAVPRFQEAKNRPYGQPQPAPAGKPRPEVSAKRPATVEVLGPNEGVSPSGSVVPPSGQPYGFGQGEAPRAGNPNDFLGAPMPPGQSGPGADVFNPDPSRWKEITYEEYRQGLIDDQRQFEQRFPVGQALPMPKARLGVAVRTNDSPVGQAFAGAPMGVRVVGVTRGTAAEKGGLEVADIIYEIDNIKVVSSDMFVKYIFGAGNKVRLKIQRDGELLEKTIALPGM